jgi:hypothetical protein
MPGGPAKKKSPLVPILIVLVLLAAGVGAYFVLAGGDDGGSPEDVARDYFNAMMDGDCDAAIGLVALGDTARDEAVSQCESVAAESGLTGDDVPQEIADMVPTELISVEVTSETDDAATVDVEFRNRGGSTDTGTVNLVKEDGDWKVAIDSVTTPSTDVPDVDVPDVPDTDEPVDDEPSGDLTDPPTDSQEAIDNPELVTLAEECGGGDMESCDELWVSTDVGGELEAYAETCGGLAPEGGVLGDCVTRFG